MPQGKRGHKILVLYFCKYFFLFLLLSESLLVFLFRWKGQHSIRNNINHCFIKQNLHIWSVTSYLYIMHFEFGHNLQTFFLLDHPLCKVPKKEVVWNSRQFPQTGPIPLNSLCYDGLVECKNYHNLYSSAVVFHCLFTIYYLLQPSEVGEEADDVVTKSPLTGIPQIDYVWDPNLPRELNGYCLFFYYWNL